MYNKVIKIVEDRHHHSHWGLSSEVLMQIARCETVQQLPTTIYQFMSQDCQDLLRNFPDSVFCVGSLSLQMIIYYQCPLWLWLPSVRLTPARFCTVATFSSDFPIGRLVAVVGGLTMLLQSGGNCSDWSGRADWLLMYHPCSQGRSSCRGIEDSLLEHNRTEMEIVSELS